MTDKRTQAESGQSNTEKDPDDWVTGDEPMTGAQRSYLTTLSQEAKVEVDEHLTKAQASRRIEELQQVTGRGAHAEGRPAAPAGGGDEGGEPPAEPSGGSGSGLDDADVRGADEEGAPVDELDVDGDGARAGGR